MKTIALTTAVLLTLKSFKHDTFSIFNITRAIREDVEDGEYELTGLGTTVFHDTVKETFTELLENVISDFYETKDSGRGYREFRMVDSSVISPTPTLPTPVANLPVVAQHSVPTPFNVTPALPGGNAIAHPATKTTLIGAPNSKWNSLPADVRATLVKYLQGGTRTMKQVQSRLKGHPYTCKDLLEYLDSAGYVDKNSDFSNPSKATTL